MVLIASFPFIGSYITPSKNGLMHDKEYIYEVIDSYIKDHPGKIMRAMQQYSISQQQERQESRLKEVMVTHADNINNKQYPSFGTGLKVIEFFDYNCGHCKRMQPIIAEILEEEGVEYIFREIPLFGESSYLASSAALAVYMIDKEKYLTFNKALLEYRGDYTEEVIKDMVAGLGIDVVAFDQLRSGTEVQELISGSIALFKALNFGGTPTFIVGDKLIEGAVDINTFKQTLHEMKQTKH